MASSTVVVSVEGTDVALLVGVGTVAAASVVGAAELAVVSAESAALEHAALTNARVSATANAGMRLRIGLLTGSRVWWPVLGKQMT